MTTLWGKSRLPAQVQSQLLIKFADQVPCRKVSRELNIAPSTVSKFFRLFRTVCAYRVGILPGNLEIRDSVLFFRLSSNRSKIYIGAGWFGTSDPFSTYVSKFSLGQLYFLGEKRLAYVGLKIAYGFVHPPEPSFKQRRSRYSWKFVASKKEIITFERRLGIKDFWMMFIDQWKTPLTVNEFNFLLGEQILRYKNTLSNGTFCKQKFIDELNETINSKKEIRIFQQV